MNWTSIVAIYLLFWVLSAFLVLPFGVKSYQEMGLEMTPGQADGAPANLYDELLAVAGVFPVVGFVLLLAMWPKSPDR